MSDRAADFSAFEPRQELQAQNEFSALLAQRRLIEEKLRAVQRAHEELRVAVDAMPFIDYGNPDTIVGHALHYAGERLADQRAARETNAERERLANEGLTGRRQAARMGARKRSAKTEERIVEFGLLAVDRAAWTHLFERLGYGRLLDQRGRDDLYRQMDRGEFLPFVDDNVRATLEALLENRDETLALGVERVFRALSKNYATNAIGQFGPKLIVDDAVVCSASPHTQVRWSSGWRADALDDLLNFLCLADGQRDDQRFSWWLQEALNRALASRHPNAIADAR
ncbi:DUF4942 domain-containing protein [Burkholderia pseudomallei]|uniref:DUF4942 domain-containing protein n=1 Tax=Burkholderia pseudomallei TaxID=28450 RepID=UPI000F2B21B4|nr:DUF4942 domain-containing protein [Burkholderia pseudomallei]CAJ3078097.1 Uncharacterised protein [Burkholderia pseudomallei]VCK72389.1 Uncharacterised protein [Burkholderia pseudomallei]VCK79800.1 Uncharacterised protein [Burkholderia pseudomallei]VCK80204.1 Uncharacterised protein [Burkholderia pseudomallei]VCK80620.1 Uncharacterised protein [Burkholderia pseudomallei]